MIVAWLRGGLTGLLLAANTVIVFALMLPPALAKLVLPAGVLRSACDQALNGLASCWVAANNAWLATSASNPWEVCGLNGLNPRGWYLVSSNHQSWVDILVLQRVFHRRIPFLKFFLKRELIWVPVIGLAWWALDFPFMRRGRGHGSGRDDLATTRQACEKFRRIPTTVINFAEGTRFTHAKHAAQRSPYQYLLTPKAGGLGMALATMGAQFDALLDVTIVYPDGAPSFWQLLCGRSGAVCVYVRRRPVPSGVIGGDPVRDKAYRRRVRAWIDEQWAEKDLFIETRLRQHHASRATANPVALNRGRHASR
ncbi:MAG TPA: acyltransferase [Ideonella sp.]|uniref:acyltransferase n=1 Tax=Ideonella sp. TaxID=1929293 RepID=UPI002E2F3DC7|nr:acyltransferase [Ideonella sp.]HEX5687514.1 acyltransferase [Ideonella sp.]